MQTRSRRRSSTAAGARSSGRISGATATTTTTVPHRGGGGIGRCSSEEQEEGIKYADQQHWVFAAARDDQMLSEICATTTPATSTTPEWLPQDEERICDRVRAGHVELDDEGPVQTATREYERHEQCLGRRTTAMTRFSVSWSWRSKWGWCGQHVGLLTACVVLLTLSSSSSPWSTPGVYGLPASGGDSEGFQKNSKCCCVWLEDGGRLCQQFYANCLALFNRVAWRGGGC